MERYVAPTKFIQYQLWQDCNNACLYCSDGNCGHGVHPTSVDRIQTLQFTMEKLDDPEVFDYQEVGIVGGELFDYQLNDPTVKEKFYEMLHKMCNMHFEKIYIATALLFDMDKHLVECLEFLRKEGVANKVLICTSWDSNWRFDTAKKFLLWKSNMQRLKKEFPDFNTHIEIILTGHFIDGVLNGTYDIKKLSEEYDSRIDFIEPASGMYYANKQELQAVCPNFFPTKEKFLKFLNKVCVKENIVDIRCLISYQIRASRIYHLDHGQFVCYADRRQPGFRVQCLDETRKYELGLIDSDQSMEDICVELCEMIERDD